MLPPAAFAQQTPPPPPTSANVVPQKIPGLTPELAEAAHLIGDGEYALAEAKIDAVLVGDVKNPQARFLKGVVQMDRGESDAAVATFQGLNEDYPELPEPYNNLAVIWAQRGEYEKARKALEVALVTRPDYAVAHENLGDVYVRLAGQEYDRAIALDKSDKSAQSKLVLVRELFAVLPAGTASKPATQPASAPKPTN